MADDLARDRERVLVGGRVVVGDAGASRVDVRAAELLCGHVLAGRGLHERRAADEDRSRAAHDHGLVGHGRDVRAAGGAGAHDDRDLRDSLGREAGLVEEDAAEVVAVGEDLGLEREEGAAGVDEVDAREAVLAGDLLRAQVLLHGERVVRAALDRGVVRDDRDLASFDDADAGDDARRGRLVVVELVGGERIQLEEGGAGVDEAVDPLAGGELAAGAVALDRLLAAALRDARGALAELGDELLHPRAPTRERVVARDLRRERRHRARAYRPPVSDTGFQAARACLATRCAGG